MLSASTRSADAVDADAEQVVDGRAQREDLRERRTAELAAAVRWQQFVASVVERERAADAQPAHHARPPLQQLTEM